jgi:hypothetical protein
MTKIAVEDPGLRDQIVSYLGVNGTDVDADTPISIQIPGSGKAPQKCQSGSGLMTAGGKFAPGYDAKLKSALYAIIRGKLDDVPEALRENGPMYRPLDQWTPEAAVDALKQYGWPEPTPPKPKAEKKVKAEAEEGEKAEPKARPKSTSTKKGRDEAAEAARQSA